LDRPHKQKLQRLTAVGSDMSKRTSTTRLIGYMDMHVLVARKCCVGRECRNRRCVTKTSSERDVLRRRKVSFDFLIGSCIDPSNDRRALAGCVSLVQSAMYAKNPQEDMFRTGFECSVEVGFRTAECSAGLACCRLFDQNDGHYTCRPVPLRSVTQCKLSQHPPRAVSESWPGITSSQARHFLIPSDKRMSTMLGGLSGARTA